MKRLSLTALLLLTPAAAPMAQGAAPVVIQPGQSTGAARGAASGTPASR